MSELLPDSGNVPGAGPVQQPIPERKESEPTPQRVLRIKIDFPGAIYDAIEAQYSKRDSMGMARGFTGETIGFVQVEDPEVPVRGVESKIHGNLMPTQWEDIPEKPGSRRGVGESRKEFNIKTTFRLPDNTFLDEQKTSQLIASLKALGYESELVPIGNGNRRLVISSPEGSFDLVIGWPNADELAKYYRKIRYDEKEAALKEGKNETEVGLEISNSHPGLGPSGIPLESKEQVIKLLNRSKDLAEVVATSLVQVLAPGQGFPGIRMDWLPPRTIEEMGNRLSSEVTGRVEATVAVRREVKEGFGFERLAGLAPETFADLRRIADRLKDPKRAAFIKKYDFRQSNGAVFWGPPGTGKTLAGEALAEETGCERVVLKIDEHMTSYMHESAARLGEKIRKIKESAVEKPVIVQIDEADAILMPVNGGGSASLRDAQEVRAVLLREFQEPSNVFFVLTTNLDPRDPRQADPAIVRNQRLGYLVSFAPPDAKGRKEIFEKETSKRGGPDLKWEGVDLESLSQATEGFSPADIQEVLSIAANEAYDPDADTAVITQENLEEAIRVIKSRKLLEEQIRRPIGFLANREQR